MYSPVVAERWGGQNQQEGRRLEGGPSLNPSGLSDHTPIRDSCVLSRSGILGVVVRRTSVQVPDVFGRKAGLKAGGLLQLGHGAHRAACCCLVVERRAERLPLPYKHDGGVGGARVPCRACTPVAVGVSGEAENVSGFETRGRRGTSEILADVVRAERIAAREVGGRGVGEEEIVPGGERGSPGPVEA